MARILIISNRLPVNIQKKNTEYQFQPSAGGLVTALKSVTQKEDSLWIGWPGIHPHTKEEKQYIRETLNVQKMHPVFLSPTIFDKFYNGFSNGTLWPLFHYYPKLAEIDEHYWDAYKKANQKFAEQILELANEDDTVWIHDYHLFLLPQMLREKMPNLNIGFFQHIPFPSYEIFRILPWRYELLEGVLAADLIGFHTFDDVRHFSSAAMRITGTKHNLGQLEYKGKTTTVDTFPISIDYKQFANSVESPEVIKKANQLQTSSGNSTLILSVDRLDISKGIPEKLLAFEAFLDKNQNYREKATLVLVVVPSRTQVEIYNKLKQQIEQEVGRINGKYGKIDWIPVRYMYRSLSFTVLSALYRCCNIALITPLRDGMNLVAKEYIASRTSGNGVLILSEMAGAAKEMQDALIVNPNNRAQIVEALETAMQMPEKEQAQRIKNMQSRLKRYDVHRWSQLFLDKLHKLQQNKKDTMHNVMTDKELQHIQNKYFNRNQRIFLLDYDGTLVNFYPSPELAIPDEELKNLLKELTADPQNHVVIISGRDKFTLEKWFEGINVCINAEHGVWSREPGEEWKVNPAVENSFIEIFRPLLEDYVDRTPGTFIEEKEFSLVWHYRQADVEFGQLRAREIISDLSYLASNLPVHIMEGNKVVEVKHASINKGIAALQLLAKGDYDMILAIGDDVTDEDLFTAMPESAITIKVGPANTKADYRLKSFKEVRGFLSNLVENNEELDLDEVEEYQTKISS